MNRVLADAIAEYGVNDATGLLSRVATRIAAQAAWLGRDCDRVSVSRSYPPNGVDGALLDFLVSSAYRVPVEIPFYPSSVGTISGWMGIVEAMAWLVIGKEPTTQQLVGTYGYRHFNVPGPLQDGFGYRTPAWKIETMWSIPNRNYELPMANQPTPATMSVEDWAGIQQSVAFGKNSSLRPPWFSLLTTDLISKALSEIKEGPKQAEQAGDSVSPFLAGPRKIAL